MAPKENLNKMEVALGTNWREAMEDSLYRMENGTNRPSGSNKLTNRFINWTNIKLMLNILYPNPTRYK